MATQRKPLNPRITVGSTMWCLWASDGGYYATRDGQLTDAQIQAGYEMTIAADTPEERARLLSQQPDEGA